MFQEVHWSYVDSSGWGRMSVVTASTSKGEKSKKFQSLDINNIYQVIMPVRHFGASF